MATASIPAALKQFVDDELLRAPLLADQVVQGAAEHLQNTVGGLSPHERSVAADLLSKLPASRQHIANYYVNSLRQQVAAELQRGGPLDVPAKSAPKELSLSLVDEHEVAIDVAISHAIESVRSTAEYELRELQTYVSALVGDMDVARDHNPFRPEVHARALWAGAQALPLSRGFQLMFMRHAAAALGQVLRKAFAGASSRLEAQGVEPAAHRTLILPSGSRRSRRPDSSFNPDLAHIRDSMPVRPPGRAGTPIEQVLAQTAAHTASLPPEADPSDFAPLREQQREQLVDSAASTSEQQSIELVSRLFDTLLSDRALPTDVRLLLSRLQAPALRLALREPKALDDLRHPLWQLADQVAFLGEILPATGHGGERERVLRYVQGLVDHVVAEPAQGAPLYDWALQRLAQHEQHRLQRRCQAVAREIADLQRLEDRLAASTVEPTTLHGTLDVAQLDTVPAELIDNESAPRLPPSEAVAWLQAQRAGDWVRLFIEGRWVHAQLLWPGERGEIYLYGHSAGDSTWAIRRPALLVLHAERLLDTLAPRRLLPQAAKRVMRQMVR